MLILIFISSCAFQSRSDNVEIVKVKEMESIKELEGISFVKSSDTNSLDLKYLKNFKNIIRNINLQEISKWAINEMKNYKLPENFIDNISLEGFYKKEKDITYFFKSIELPTHSPLVKRFLYIGFNYKDSKLKKIIITIQGYAEE
ncbi:MAG: hypothetical protein KatS3mg068_1982 [Candidatus Sericytochromatia bacterium]|nr:MAG: hypothetical protein KatS3mg068_1982 [Candidatus Sericytochromatia bacterium]